MANTKISALTAIDGATLASTDLVPVVDVSDTTMAGTGTNKKLTAAELGVALAAVGGLASTSAVAAGYQPLDSDLTAIAALTTTEFGRSFLTLANAAAGLTLIGGDKFPVTFSVSLAVGVQTGQHRIYAEETLTIEQVRASVGTAPTGSTLIVDVNKNGTTIFTTQGRRPAIAISEFTATPSAAIEVTSLAQGDYLTVDVDQVGSTIAGSDLTVTIVLRRG